MYGRGKPLCEGYATGNAGNIGARLEGDWLTALINCCLGRNDPAEIVEVSTAPVIAIAAMELYFAVHRGGMEPFNLNHG
jgi:hypothetical protein